MRQGHGSLCALVLGYACTRIAGASHLAQHLRPQLRPSLRGGDTAADYALAIAESVDELTERMAFDELTDGFDEVATEWWAGTGAQVPTGGRMDTNATAEAAIRAASWRMDMEATAKDVPDDDLFIPAVSHRPKVLLVDLRGPSRFQGDGVRVMGMLVDLQEACDYEVHVVSNSANETELRSGWDAQVHDRYLKNVKLWGPADFQAGRVGHLASFSHIIVGCKLDLMQPKGAGVASGILRDLAKANVPRSRVSAFWDDVPFERCAFKDLCQAVPRTVRRVARVAMHFYFLTPEDLSLMREEMGEHEVGDVSYRVWPMRLRNMGRLLPGQRFAAREEMSRAALQRQTRGSGSGLADPEGKKYLTMMGNNHPVNLLNIAHLFDDGIVARICSEVRKVGSPVKILFLGPLAKEVHHFKMKAPGAPKSTQCVEIVDGLVGEKELAENYLPQTRAVLNPFFFDVRSGISVKSFEAVTAGFPFITSAYGLHGLRHIGECQFPVVEQPADAESFSRFVLERVIDDAGYYAFAQSFLAQSKDCMYGQAKLYSPAEICMVL